MPTTISTPTMAPVYKYITVELVTNKILAELPFSGVSYSRALKGAGEFSGTLPINAETEKHDLYVTTLPGKTALYIVRDGVCVWGGIIWSRDYDLVGRSLSVSASEFTSYFSKRAIWQTMSYQYSGHIVKNTANGSLAKVYFADNEQTSPQLEPGDGVNITFTADYITNNGYYQILGKNTTPTAPSDPDLDGFYVYAPTLPAFDAGAYTDINITVLSKISDYVKDLINSALNDFSDSKYSNKILEPGISTPTIVNRRSRSSGIATIQTDSVANNTTAPYVGPFQAVPGQTVDIKNVGSGYNLTANVISVSSDRKTITYASPGSDESTTAVTSPTYSVVARRIVSTKNRKKIISIIRSGNVATVTTQYPHGYFVGQRLLINTSISDYNNSNVPVTVGSINIPLKQFTYSNPGSNKSIKNLKNTKSYCEATTPVAYAEITTNSSSGLKTGDTISVLNVDGIDPYNSAWKTSIYNGVHTIDDTPDNTTIRFFPTQDSVYQEPYVSFSIAQASFNKTTNKATLKLSGSHIFKVGDTISVTTDGKKSNDNSGFFVHDSVVVTAISNSGDVPSGQYDKLSYAPKNYNYNKTISAHNISGSVTLLYKKVSGTVSVTPVLISKTYGSFPKNASLDSSSTDPGYRGLDFSSSYGNGATIQSVQTYVGSARYTTTSSHGFTVGQYVTVTDANPANLNIFNRRIDATTSNTFTVALPSFTSGGPYTTSGNANIDNYDYNSQTNSIIRGSDLTTIDKILEQYSGSLSGFDYRVDCSIVNGKFKRTFYFIPVVPTDVKGYLPLSVGSVVPITAYGAQKLVFEYPGNISTLTINETANNSATRVFVVGNNDDTGANSAALFSAASATDLLSNNWPILDESIKKDWPLIGIGVINPDKWDGIDAETDFYKSAKRALSHMKPPIGEFSITVNGSLNPVIGSYFPGDWCSLIINDKFIKNRLTSGLEPRTDVLVRRIDEINVTVPDSPSYPEEVTLVLLPEWEVDQVGQ